MSNSSSTLLASALSVKMRSLASLRVRPLSRSSGRLSNRAPSCSCVNAEEPSGICLSTKEQIA